MAANEDFNIKVVTTADTSGIQQTAAGLETLKQQAEKIRQDAGAKALMPPPVAEKETGLTGTAIGVGTIITLLTSAINKWKAFSDEQDRWVEGMIKAQEKSRELGLSVADMLDAMKSVERIQTEPLRVSFDRLKQKVIELKTEMQLAFGSGDYDAVKKYAAQLGVVESQLRGVTAGLDREAEAADRDKKALQSELDKRVPGLANQDQIKEADAQTQRILMNEQAAAKARAEGRDQDADMFEKSAEQYKAGATPQQLADLQRIHDLQDKLKPPAPPTYQPLSPEEFQRQSDAANKAAGGSYSDDEMKQHQLDARAERYKDVQNTRQESDAAKKGREEELERAFDKVMAKYWQ